MTNIYIAENNNGKKEIYCKGHSGYAMAGADIVCAAISMLTYAFDRVCIELDKKNKLQLNEMKISDGEIYTVISDPVNSADSAFYMLKAGLTSLEENYPKNVKIFTVWEDFQKSSLV